MIGERDMAVYSIGRRTTEITAVKTVRMPPLISQRSHLLLIFTHYIIVALKLYIFSIPIK